MQREGWDSCNNGLHYSPRCWGRQDNNWVGRHSRTDGAEWASIRHIRFCNVCCQFSLLHCIKHHLQGHFFPSKTWLYSHRIYNNAFLTSQNKAPQPPSGALGKQAVALRISADNAAFIGCKFIGAQDTLYDHTGRHYFKNCYIEGSVDFIFGNGLSLYKDCHLHAKTKRYGALTAQNRQSFLEETGFSFVNCKVTGSGALYLGRAWGTFSRVVFAYTYMDKIITPTGWYNWGDKTREMYGFLPSFSNQSNPGTRSKCICDLVLQDCVLWAVPVFRTRSWIWRQSFMVQGAYQRRGWAIYLGWFHRWTWLDSCPS